MAEGRSSSVVGVVALVVLGLGLVVYHRVRESQSTSAANTYTNPQDAPSNGSGTGLETGSGNSREPGRSVGRAPDPKTPGDAGKEVVEGVTDAIIKEAPGAAQEAEELAVAGDNWHVRLLIASTHGYLKRAKEALSHGADVNYANSHVVLGIEEGEFPLYLAAKNGHLEIVELLLGSGAKKSQTVEGKTAYMVASGAAADEIRRLTKVQ